MGRDPRQIAARNWLVLALALSGDGCSTSTVQLSTGSPQPVVSAPGGSTFGGLIAAGVLGAFAYESEKGMRYRANPFGAVLQPAPFAPPPLDPTRRVVEVDCTKPIEDWSANLRCR